LKNQRKLRKKWRGVEKKTPVFAGWFFFLQELRETGENGVDG